MNDNYSGLPIDGYGTPIITNALHSSFLKSKPSEYLPPIVAKKIPPSGVAAIFKYCLI